MPRTQKGGPVRGEELFGNIEKHQRCNEYMVMRSRRRQGIIAEDPDWKETEEATEYDRETSQKMVEILSAPPFPI